jgi:hypothetical protein
MPLQIENVVNLNPQMAEATTPEVEFDQIPPPPADGIPKPIILAVPHNLQEGKLWCWAACVNMVLEYYKKGIRQCDVVKIKLGIMNLGEPNHDECVDGFANREDDCDPMEMAQVWRKCGIANPIPSSEVLNADGIKAELQAGRPIQVGIHWLPGNGEHAILIKGWAATSPEAFVIDDPLRDNTLLGVSGRATYEELTTAFTHGEWWYTWSHLI